MDSRSLTRVSTDNENVLTVSLCVCVYLLPPPVYPVHQLVSTITLLSQVQLQLTDPVLLKAFTSINLDLWKSASKTTR